MPARLRAVDRGTARGREVVADLMREAEAARLDRNLSFAEIGRAIGIDRAQVARICRGESRHLSIVRAAQLLAVVGLDLGARAYPGGQPIRDAAQLALLGRLRHIAGPSIRWRFEVPVTAELAVEDRRAWDAALDGQGWSIRVEAETGVRDIQALQRRIALKQRDGGIACVALLLSDTRHHRALLRSHGEALRSQFPCSPRVALRALRAGMPPPRNAILVL